MNILLQLWTLFEEPKEEILENVVIERKINYKTIVVTEVTKDLHFYAQNVETGESDARSIYIINNTLEPRYNTGQWSQCNVMLCNWNYLMARPSR